MAILPWFPVDFPLKPIVCEAQSAVESGVPNLNRRAIAGRRKRLKG